jgi:hypothetical protein
MSPQLAKTIKKYVLVIAMFVGVLILYALSLGPVLRLFDTAHAPAGYNRLPSIIRLFYYPLQNIPWPGIYCRYLVAVSEPPRKHYVLTEAERAAWC